MSRFAKSQLGVFVILAIVAALMGSSAVLQTRQDPDSLEALVQRLRERGSGFGGTVVDFNEFKKYGHAAFDRLIVETRVAGAEYRKIEEEQEKAGLLFSDLSIEEIKASFDTFSWYSDCASALLSVSSEDDSVELLALWVELGEHQPYGFGRDLAEVVAPDRAVPVFTELLEDPGVKRDDRRRLFCADYLLEHPSESAIEVMARVLNDKGEDYQLRQLLLGRLAGAGGEVGISAVIGAMPGDRSVPSMLQGTKMTDQAFELSQWRLDRPGILALHTTSDGSQFCAFTSPFLGGYRDLWIGKFVGGRCVDVAFTGEMVQEPSEYDRRVSSFNSNWIKLIDDGKWVEEVLGAPGLWKDTDSDGLTDLAEVRIGTDPKSVDTDSDGKRDDVDTSPLVPPRRLSPDEQAVKAAVSVFIGYSSSRSLFNFEPEGYEPFELYLGGRAATVDRSIHRDLKRGMTSPMVNTLSANIEKRLTGGSHPSGFEEVLLIAVRWDSGGETYHMTNVRGCWIPVDKTDQWVS